MGVGRQRPFRAGGRLTVALATAAMATALAATALLSADSGIAGGRGAALLPDLLTERPTDLTVRKRHDRRLLRLTNTVSNQGAGPLEIEPDEPTGPCDPDEQRAFQVLYLDDGDGVFERAFDTGTRREPVGCRHYHPAHRHWHLKGFVRYSLRRERTGRTVASSRKVSFCLVDTERRYELPGSPAVGFYNACRKRSTQGISVGWIDSYRYVVPGQRIGVTGLRPARYCLISTVNPPSKRRPHGRLREEAAANNSRAIRIRLNPRKRRVRELDGRCRSA